MLRRLFHEHRRSSSVDELRVLYSPAEPAFDELVSSAAAAFDAPIALLSLIHRKEQWFKASHGLAIDCISRDRGFCSFALDSDEALESCDPQSDPRFAQLPVVVDEPYIRYYLGTPLRRLNGTDVGALCVLDTKARPPASVDQKAYLRGLARRASRMLDSRAGLWNSAS